MTLRVTLADAVARCRPLTGRGHRVLLGITGEPAAGKSTVAAALADALGPDLAVVIPMDGFHLSNDELRDLGRLQRKGAPDTFDAAGFAQLLGALRSAYRVTDCSAPAFDREREETVPFAITVGAAVPLLIVEGNYLLLDDDHWNPVRAALDEVWYLAVDDTVRTERLIARHMAHGRSRADATTWATGSDQRNAELIASTRDRADLVLMLDQ